jgi:hypothetical protein
MILTPEEERAALDAVLEIVNAPDFKVANITLDAPARFDRNVYIDIKGHTGNPHNRMPNAKRFVDTGVRVITIIGHVPLQPPSYGPLVSETAEEAGGLVMDDG